MASGSRTQHQRFLRLFTTHEPAIRAFVRRLVPSRTDADDILQEVAIVLWEKFDEFREGGDFKAWACGIARYKVLAWLRDRGRDRLVLDSDVVEIIATQSLEQEPVLQQQREHLEDCLESVPHAERKLLAQAYQPGAVIREVAAASGRSVGGFYQWLHRMRQMLLNCVKRRLAPEGA
ncbi:RNA polymerase sigma factor [Maioricimonas rarisocia]|uniref:RNA polymerase sigma factor n=1 Tax=Maioricimonas rarisocia TaxID=2528026 RepID=A0A517Z816_9PLAN|nr:sigma-70 family RNA polymerase sigma factor [Maioricimonas rarisocia]QDU38616.1 RNA polymerase sigma factor [Maioricimonas rarisocia]